MVRSLAVLALTFATLTLRVWSAPSSQGVGAQSLPMTCAELLPDVTPYLLFFDAVGRTQVSRDRRFSKRLYRILALRDRLNDFADKGSDINPVDALIRKTLCFYREQKEPIKPVPYDDAEFLSFLKTSLPELEKKVDAAVFQWELERQEKKEFERRAHKNQQIVESILREAEIEAEQTFDQLARRAKKKAQSP